MSTLDFTKNTLVDLDFDGSSYRQFLVSDLRSGGVPEPIILAAVQTRLKAEIDAMAERIRNGVTTPGAGQAMEYQEAQSQAGAALKAPSSATPEKYPMLAASIGIDVDPSTGEKATDVAGVARAVDAAYQAWKAIGSEIRRVRLMAKAAIDGAATIEDAAAAYDAIAWPRLAS